MKIPSAKAVDAFRELLYPFLRRRATTAQPSSLQDRPDLQDWREAADVEELTDAPGED